MWTETHRGRVEHEEEAVSQVGQGEGYGTKYRQAQKWQPSCHLEHPCVRYGRRHTSKGLKLIVVFVTQLSLTSSPSACYVLPLRRAPNTSPASAARVQFLQWLAGWGLMCVPLLKCSLMLCLFLAFRPTVCHDYLVKEGATLYCIYPSSTN